ncbi:hypothetical protein GCM10010464_60900 [Pseudonocardia yunnanensis]|uniref:Uncharacterized protein n=1 Tax=Pseudonocardia yunnanensis TaxID=58107 RepID=A0ABW4EMN0_9PSEU
MTGTTAGHGCPTSLTGADSARSERIARTCALGDPLADTVAAELHDRGRIARRSLAGLLAAGDTAGTLTPAQADLWHDVQAAGIEDLLGRGALVHHRADPESVRIVHGASSVAHVGAASDSPWSTSRLIRDGRLRPVAHRRVADTVHWAVIALEPGSLLADGPAHRATLRLRLRAAVLRHAQLHGLAAHTDPVLPGTPITQLDLLRCWLGATVRARALLTESRAVAAPVPAELRRIWQHLGHLLGVHAELLDAPGHLLELAAPGGVDVRRGASPALTAAVAVAVVDALTGEPPLVRSPRERILRTVRTVHRRAQKHPEAFAG